MEDFASAFKITGRVLIKFLFAIDIDLMGGTEREPRKLTILLENRARVGIYVNEQCDDHGYGDQPPRRESQYTR